MNRTRTDLQLLRDFRCSHFPFALQEYFDNLTLPIRHLNHIRSPYGQMKEQHMQRLLPIACTLLFGQER